MTPREIARVHFPNLAPTLLADRSVVAVTPAGDISWAGGVTWELARAVARSGRRVLLVDLSLEEPALGTGATDAAGQGIVDAFAFGVALNHVAREQEPNLYYIGTGSPGAQAAEVVASDRWQRLARGFASEGALLVLFVPAALLPTLKVDLGALVVAAKDGFTVDGATFPGISTRVRAGTPLVAVVREDPPPAPVRASGATRSSGARGRSVSVAQAMAARRQGRRAGTRAGLVLVAVSGTLVGLVALVRWVRTGPASPPASPERVVASPRRPSPLPPAGRAPAPADSLFYSIQIAAFNAPERAVAYLSGLEQDGLTGTVTPVMLGQQGWWHRVLVGLAPSPAAADSLLRELWRRGAVRQPNGTILRTPFALEIARASSPEEARDTALALRRRGVAAYIVAAADGTVRLLVGAFEDHDQGRAADSLLGASGITGALVLRAGQRP
jgi:cell division septation protein DedD